MSFDLVNSVMTSAVMTPWFDKQIKPTHPGYYLVVSSFHFSDDPKWLYWDGKLWVWKDQGYGSCYYQQHYWCGLLADPTASDAESYERCRREIVIESQRHIDRVSALSKKELGDVWLKAAIEHSASIARWQLDAFSPLADSDRPSHDREYGRRLS